MLIERRWNKQTSAYDSNRFYSGDKQNFSVDSEQALLLFFFVILFWVELKGFWACVFVSEAGEESEMFLCTVTPWDPQVLGWDDSPVRELLPPAGSRSWVGAASVHLLPGEPCRGSVLGHLFALLTAGK